MRDDTTVRLGRPQAMGGADEPRPLSDRILARLPGPRPVWIAAWALVPWVSAALAQLPQTAGELPRWENSAAELLDRTAFSIAIALSLWGAPRIARGLGALRSRLAELLGGTDDPLELFRGMGSTVAPLVMTVAAAATFGAQSVVAHGSWLRALVAAGSWLLIGVALWSLIWVDLNLHVGLHQLGRRQLSLAAYPSDRSLGLRPLGTLAFTGFWILLAALAPLLVATGANRLGLSVGLLVLLVGVGAFFLSLRRLNRQMVAAKQREVAWARRLYEEAVRPVRQEGTLEALLRQSALLSAAEALEKRAERIQEWPFDEATFARVVAISSTVVAAIIARILLAPFGI